MKSLGQAKIPIIKAVHVETGTNVDISFKNDKAGVRTVLRFLEEYPESKYLIVFLKVFLKQKGLNDTYQGYIGSYLLYNMVIASMQHYQSREDFEENWEYVGLGHYLANFFNFYGFQINYERVSVSVAEGGSYKPKLAALNFPDPSL